MPAAATIDQSPSCAVPQKPPTVGFSPFGSASQWPSTGLLLMILPDPDFQREIRRNFYAAIALEFWAVSTTDRLTISSRIRA